MNEHSRTQRSLSRPQAFVLGVVAVPMVAAGALGAWGTYTNVLSGFDRSATALGAVAAGEGATLVLAMLHIGLTMLGQGAPRVVRTGLWVLPIVAAVVGVTVANDVTEGIVYGVTPLAMCVSAEGLALLARRLVVYRTGEDIGARQHETETLGKIAYHRARADRHPDPKIRKRSERKVWRLASRLGVGVDPAVTTSILASAGAWMAHGSDAALGAIYGGPSNGTVTPVAPVGTQASRDLSRYGDTHPSQGGHGLSLAEMSAVTGVPMPEAGEQLTDDQVGLVLRYLRYGQDPPMSYRAAATMFRTAGFMCSEERLRIAFSVLVDAETRGSQP